MTADAVMGDVPPPGPPPLLLFVTQVQDAKTVWVEISINDSVGHLKKLVAKKTGIDVEHQELIFDGNSLADDAKIKDCKMEQEVTIHLADKRHTPEETKPAEPEPAA